MKALIADDDEVVLEGLSQVLPWKEFGFGRVIRARNGEEAYQSALAEEPDLVITDIRMPLLDGLELSGKIQRSMKNVLIVIMSAYEDFQYAKKAMQYGVSDYILKPIDMEKIGQLTEKLRQASQNHDEQKNILCNLYDGDLESRVKKILLENDHGAAQAFFRDERVWGMPASEIEKLSVRMIDLLYTYFQDIGINLGRIYRPKAEVLAEVSELKTGEEIREHTVRLFLDALHFVALEKPRHEQMIANAAKKIVEREYGHSDLSLQLIADRVGVSPSRLSVLFRKTFGTNFCVYLNSWRIGKSCQLLRNISLRIEDIGGMVGYTDAHYFAKVFKKVKRMTPSEYRNLNGGAEYAGQ